MTVKTVIEKQPDYLRLRSYFNDNNCSISCSNMIYF